MFTSWLLFSSKYAVGVLVFLDAYKNLAFEQMSVKYKKMLLIHSADDHSF